MNLKYIIIIIVLISCSTNKSIEKIDETELRKYELAYNSITNKIGKEKPFLKDFKSDASGVKIIPRLYKLNNLTIYRSENFNNENSYETSEIKILSKKYTRN